MTSAPSKMDEGVPEVGEASSSSKEPIPVLPPITLDALVPLYEVGVMQKSSGYRGVHPYHSIAIHSVPRQMVGQYFQEWYAITHTSCQLPEGDPSSVDVSIPNTTELHVETVGLEH